MQLAASHSKECSQICCCCCLVLQLCKKADALARSIARYDEVLAVSGSGITMTFPAGWEVAQHWLAVELPKHILVS
jgi:hypothetical protein